MTVQPLPPEAFIDRSGPAPMTVEHILASGSCKVHGHGGDIGNFGADARLIFQHPCSDHHPRVPLPNSNCGQPFCSICGLGLVKQDEREIDAALAKLLRGI